MLRAAPRARRALPLRRVSALYSIQLAIPRERANAAALWPLASNSVRREVMSGEVGLGGIEVLMHRRVHRQPSVDQMGWPDSYVASTWRGVLLRSPTKHHEVRLRSVSTPSTGY